MSPALFTIEQKLLKISEMGVTCMQTYRLGLALLIALFIPVASFSQETRIATVDFERLVVGSAAGQKAANEWNTKYAEAQQRLQARQREIEDDQNKLRTQSNVLSEAARAELTRGIERKTTELNRLSEDAQREMEELRARLLQPITETAQRTLQAYVNEKGFTLVIDTSNPGANIIHVNETLDITNDVIQRVDAAAPAPAAPAAAPAPAPAPQR
jgi:outer membrane protein